MGKMEKKMEITGIIGMMEGLSRDYREDIGVMWGLRVWDLGFIGFRA